MVSKWKLDIHKQMRLSESLFVPSMGLKWHFKGTHVHLTQRGEIIWHSHMDYTGKWYESWDYVSLNAVARLIQVYLHASVEDIRKGEPVAHFNRRFTASKGRRELFAILRACDRRIGRNYQSKMLFIEPSQLIRNLIGSRV
jgi:hypothetical protein